jgi:hypothetical protein
VFGPLDRRIAPVLGKLGIEALNTKDAIPKNRYPAEYKVHQIHPSREGHRVLGELLEKWLDDHGGTRALPKSP